MTPHGYTDSEWRKMGIKTAAEIPAAVEKQRKEALKAEKVKEPEAPKKEKTKKK